MDFLEAAARHSLPRPLAAESFGAPARDGEDLELERAIHASRREQPRSSENTYAWTTQSEMRAIVNQWMSELPLDGHEPAS